MIHEIFMPALSSTMTEGKITAWVKSPGDKIEKGETVLIVESDKADMDVESFNEGILAAIVVQAGDSAPVGSALGLLAETEAEIEEAKQKAAALAGGGSASAPAPAAAAPVAAPTAAASGNGSSAAAPARPSGRIVASPRAKKLAKDLGVNLTTLVGTGPHGRIVAEDVEAAVGKPSAPVATPVIAAPPAPAAKPVAAKAPAAPVAPPTPGQVQAMNTMQVAVVKNMVATLEVPVFRVGYTITTDALDKLYKQVKSKGVTMSALLAKAVAMTLQKHPLLNASYVENGIHYNGSINIAVAVAMPDGGLITPVLRSADQQDLYSLSRSWKDLVDRARSKQLTPDEYSTGTFTISNLGMFGVDTFDAILPPGQGSIIAIGAARPTVVANEDGMIGVKRQMQVNITCDHRIIYGAHAAAFLKDLAKLIETDVQSLTL
ncbi:dihydrolipoamide acetyltransferase family protein [Alkalinema sp. FACHB-956]|uniref:dihydrolipoamide acetyltransferase family protein n=1 Tax=Alkalinema sp. FACHB-956 TaxID=2692768 RepID=UPI001687D3EF|nr:dihydrolipoamide acetyltransferase family protein [Alkalinema sp. FACHB-956]MBD2326064.1 2-oxo acid dehydrogenase subunit E2 [Alkalinema sp. FACHB-956]